MRAGSRVHLVGKPLVLGEVEELWPERLPGGRRRALVAWDRSDRYGRNLQQHGKWGPRDGWYDFAELVNVTATSVRAGAMRSGPHCPICRGPHVRGSHARRH